MHLIRRRGENYPVSCPVCFPWTCIMTISSKSILCRKARGPQRRNLSYFSMSPSGTHLPHGHLGSGTCQGALCALPWDLLWRGTHFHFHAHLHAHRCTGSNFTRRAEPRVLWSSNMKHSSYHVLRCKMQEYDSFSRVGHDWTSVTAQ